MSTDKAAAGTGGGVPNGTGSSNGNGNGNGNGNFEPKTLWGFLLRVMDKHGVWVVLVCAILYFVRTDIVLPLMSMSNRYLDARVQAEQTNAQCLVSINEAMIAQTKTVQQVSELTQQTHEYNIRFAKEHEEILNFLERVLLGNVGETTSSTEN